VVVGWPLAVGWIALQKVSVVKIQTFVAIFTPTRKQEDGITVGNICLAANNVYVFTAV
jgi:hypothetical protein